MRQSETLGEFAKAFVAAQTELKNPYASSVADMQTYRYKYAPLDDILNDVRTVLGRHGLALLQETETGQSAVGVRTVILHESGQWVEFGPLLLPAGNTAQTAGSATTYARRYALCAALGIAADEDDDARTSAESSAGREVPSGIPPSPSQPTNARGSVEGGEESHPSSPSTSSEPGDARPSGDEHGEGSTSVEGSPSAPTTSTERRDHLWMQLLEYCGSKKKAVSEVNKRCKTGFTERQAHLIEVDELEKTLREVLREAG